jgi:hypothetical protein
VKYYFCHFQDQVDAAEDNSVCGSVRAGPQQG